MTSSIPVFLPPELVMLRFCAHSRAGIDTLRGPAVTRDITRLRHEAMWLLRNLTTASLDQIGAMFDRAGATADEGIGKIARRIETEPDYRSRMVALLGLLASGQCDVLPLPAVTAVNPDGDVHRLMAAAILNDPRFSDEDAKRGAHNILTLGLPEVASPELPKGN